MLFKSTSVIIILVLFITACSGPTRLQKNLPVRTGADKYDSAFPVQATAEALHSIAESVKLVSSLTFYKKFFFRRQKALVVSDFKNPAIFKQASSSVIVEIPASGTATIIYADKNKIALLTCAHTVSSGDTLFNYYADDQGRPTPFVESVAVKIRQSLNVIGVPRGQENEILAMDTENDLAILGKRLFVGEDTKVRVFPYPWGTAKDLDWGTFVYLVGFPHGKKMVSNAIVSNPLYQKNQAFIINATMYQGVSGGIVVALRGGVPNFELVGMANALSAKNTLVLKPEAYINPEAINPSQPYQGQIYLDREVKIINGITFAIPVDKIRSFMDENNEMLQEKGYFVDY